jgi:methyl halide transferase
VAPADEYADFFRQRYVVGDPPWDTGRPSEELVHALAAGLLPGKSALEFGCGTGTNAIEFARRGVRVTAVDLVEVAIDKARAKARRAGVTVDFRVGDLTQLDLGGPYDILFDLGVYHSMRSRDLSGFLKTLRRVSRPGTRWLSLSGNSKEPHDRGPPTVSEAEIRSELGSLFKFIDVHEFRFDLGSGFQPLGWSVLMERREAPHRQSHALREKNEKAGREGVGRTTFGGAAPLTRPRRPKRRVGSARSGTAHRPGIRTVRR